MSNNMNNFKSKFKIEELKIYETEYWIWSLRPVQVTLGSGVLSLKRECDASSELSAKEFADLSNIIKVIEQTLKSIFSYDIMNYLMLMMVDKQVHYHVIPRYKNSVYLFDDNWQDVAWPGIPNLVGEVLEIEKLFDICSYIKTNLSIEQTNVFKKYKVGYTTGVFDMFHIGHLNLLKRAKEQCMFLIVGVTTDELVSYKNKQAIIPHVERMAIIESVKYVDKVVPQVNMNKMDAWKEYKFDVMFVGSDWKGTEKWNEFERQFSEIGVDIVYFPYTQGTSSTELRKVLHKIIQID